jgi:lipopolysaccharide transport system permease protein
VLRSSHVTEAKPHLIARVWSVMRELVRYRQLLWCLVTRDLRVRYKRSVLGVAWAFAEPLFLTILFTTVFSYILVVDTPRYPVFVLIGVLVWGFFHTGVTYALGSVSGNRSLVKKIYFPREILPLATVLGRFVHFVLSLLLLIPLLLYFRVALTVHVLYVPLLLVLQLTLVLGLALLLTALSTLFEDVAFIVGFLFTGLFYLSPVFYPVEAVPVALRGVYLLNPVSALIASYRAILLDGVAPPWQPLGVAAALSVLLLLAGTWVFRRYEWSFAEVL